MVQQEYSVQVATLIPLFYIAWSDAVLSPTEVKLIQDEINHYDWLTNEDKTLLESWSNPQNPPSEALFQSWVSHIKVAADNLPNEERQNLVQIGIKMAKIQAEEDSLSWLTDDVVKGLRTLEDAVGYYDIKLHKELFDYEQTEKDKEESKLDVQALQAVLDDDYAELRQHIFKLLHDPMFEYKTLRNKEDYREHVLKWCQVLADQGYGALSFPEEYGGKHDIGAFAAAFETLGYHDLSLVVKFGVQFGLWGGAVMWLGTKEHHDLYLKDIGSLELPGCFAMTETGHGSNVNGCETTATYDPAQDEIIINTPSDSAAKDYIGNAAVHGQMAAVFAQLIVDGENHGVHAIVVPLRDKAGTVHQGVRIEDCAYKLGLNGVDNGRIWFDHVRVPRAALLNRFGSIDDNGVYSSPIEKKSKRFFTMLGTLVGGRICVPRAGLSAAKTALTIAVRYSLKRRQFGEEGKPETIILDYPSHQRRLMPRLAKAYALDFALTYLAKRFSNKTEEEMREIETMAAGLKSYATWFTTDTIQACREACGGKGYLAENRFADLKADSDIFTTFEGDNTVLMQLVAKGVMSEFQREAIGGGFVGMVSFAVEYFADTLRNKNFINTNNTNESHLRDRAFLLEAFEYRQQDLTVSAAQRLRKFIKRGLTPYHAFLKCQTHFLEVANAYIEQLVLRQFYAVIDACEDTKLKATLSMICELYGLHTIEENKGWYLEQGCISGAKSRAIRRTVDKLCHLMREDALDLVNAFGIPDECLAAPIALDD